LNGATGRSDIEGEAARVAASDAGVSEFQLRRMQPEEKDLRQRTKEFALQIIRLFSELPKTTEAQVLGKQVLRSGTSVGANLSGKNGATGMSDIHGNAVRVSESEAGVERMNATNLLPFLLRF
jgi:hypothetical protein